MKIYITGISGTGKTTIARELEKRGISSMSIDEVPGLCHWINNADGSTVDYDAVLNAEFINAHEWVCDEAYLQKLIAHKASVVVLGLAFNQDNFLHLFDKVLLLTCSPETFIARINARDDNDFGKDASAQKLILDSYKTFEDQMLQKGAIALDVEGTISDVVEKILLHL
jgi:dephospho-CoA kinase